MRNVLKSVFSKKVSAAVLTAVMLFVSVFSMSMIASAASFSPRLSAPSSSNKYYYSNLNVFYNLRSNHRYRDFIDISKIRESYEETLINYELQTVENDLEIERINKLDIKIKKEALKKVKEKLRLHNQSFVHDLKCLVVRFLLNRFQSLDLILHKYKV